MNRLYFELKEVGGFFLIKWIGEFFELDRLGVKHEVG